MSGVLFFIVVKRVRCVVLYCSETCQVCCSLLQGDVSGVLFFIAGRRVRCVVLYCSETC